jgi:hypothetical protein
MFCDLEALYSAFEDWPLGLDLNGHLEGTMSNPWQEMVEFRAA